MCTQLKSKERIKPKIEKSITLFDATHAMTSIYPGAQPGLKYCSESEKITGRAVGSQGEDCSIGPVATKKVHL